MAITTVNGIIGAGKQTLVWVKTGMSNVAAAGVWTSSWNMAGTPGAGTLSAGNTTTGTTFTDATTGAPTFVNPTGGNFSYISKLWFNASQVGTWVLFDRVVGVGALTPSNTTYTSLAVSEISSSRIGDGGDCELWAETVTTLGAATYAQTVNYTDADGNSKTATLTLAQTAAPNMLPFVMGAAPARGIKAITSASGNTNGSGTFNILILRRLLEVNIDVANSGKVLDFPQTGFPRVYDDSCLFWAWLGTTGTEPTFSCSLQLAQG
jgi:hypothetical protein